MVGEADRLAHGGAGTGLGEDELGCLRRQGRGSTEQDEAGEQDSPHGRDSGWGQGHYGAARPEVQRRRLASR